MSLINNPNASLLDLYTYICGISEVPAMWNTFCCLSIVAATISDRIVLQTGNRRVLPPNLYTLLIGISGGGKDQAIEGALPYIRGLPNVEIMEGITSGRALVQEMADRGVKVASATGRVGRSSKLFLVTKELADSIGTGEQAGGFIRAVTALFTVAGTEANHSYRTLSFGAADVTKPCLNWLGASTKEWFRKSVTHEDMKSGFGARACVVLDDRPWDHVRRLRRVIEPPDYWQVADFITGYMEMLSNLCVDERGYFKLTSEAADIEERWMVSRPLPSTEELMPLWRRQQVLMLKLAMNLALCDLRHDTLCLNPVTVPIEARHVQYAIELAEQVFSDTKELLWLVHGTRDFEELNSIRSIIRGAVKSSRGRIPVVTMRRLKYLAGQQGITSDRVEKYLRTLVEGGQVQSLSAKGEAQAGWNGVMFQWMGDRIEVPEGIEALLDGDGETDDETEGETVH